MVGKGGGEVFDVKVMAHFRLIGSIAAPDFETQKRTDRQKAAVIIIKLIEKYRPLLF